MKKFLLILLSLMTLNSCETEFWYRLTRAKWGIFVCNNTNIQLMIYGTHTQRDTVLPKSMHVQLEHFTPSKYLTVSPYEHIMLKSYDWTEDLSHEDTIRLYIFVRDTIEKYDWATIVDKYMVLHRYDLTKQDCENMNWSIPFPPDESMKDIKMYPPYEEAIKQFE